MRPIFVTAIDTGIGKTVVSAILVERLKADYWKPIQSGDLDNSDTQTVKRLVTNPATVFHPEAYRLTQPFSPHKSAELDGISIDLNNIKVPETPNQLVIEGAGGLMVPLNDKHFIIDLIQKFEAEVVLVVRHYLGSINHTLLSLSILQQRGIPVSSIVILGENDLYSEKAIRNFAGDIKFETIPLTDHVDRAFILRHC
ncbi:dethiobiotin synthase [Arcticibacter sp. MXS-1]|uniref:dethiobiotin synthase n=1 Tax=Arcticibacter sp. MXS-1 TaxID=3341726 RepID=UPI0035A8852D